MGGFGAVIPVTGLNLGFVGQISRTGERVVTARQADAANATNIPFGGAVVILNAAPPGTYQSIKDFIANGGAFTTAKFAGIAIREVKTNLAYVSLENIGSPVVGSYTPGEEMEVLERGSIVVPILVGAPVPQGPVYVRTALNGAFPAGVVGGLEAVADGGNTVPLTNVVFRTGVQDANGNAEITLLTRVAA